MTIVIRNDGSLQVYPVHDTFPTSEKGRYAPPLSRRKGSDPGGVRTREPVGQRRVQTRSDTGVVAPLIENPEGTSMTLE